MTNVFSTIKTKYSILNVDLNLLIKIGFEMESEINIENNKQIAKSFLTFYSLCDPTTDDFKYSIEVEKKFVTEEINNIKNIMTDGDNSNNSNKETFNTIMINKSFLLLIENSKLILKVLISHKRSNYDEEVDESDKESIEEKRIVEINKENNLFLFTFRQIIQVFRNKFNEENGFLLSTKNKFSRITLLNYFDSLIEITSYFTNCITEINSFYEEKKLQDDFSFSLKECGSLIESYVQVIYKDIKKSMIDMLLLKKIQSKLDFDNLIKELSGFIEEINNIVRISNISKEYIINFIYYTSTNLFNNEINKLNQQEQVYFFDFFTILIKNTNLNEKTNNALLSNLKEHKSRLNIA